MKLLQKESNSPAASGLECAALLMDVIPSTMRYIRREMRSRRLRGLSVPQLRTLGFLYRNEGASLSDVAREVGLTLPSTSKIVDALVIRELITRAASPGDRRYISLNLTKLGHATFMQARRYTEACLAERIATLSSAERATVSEAMQTLRSIFALTDTRSGGK